MGKRFWLLPVAAAGAALAVLGLRRLRSDEVADNLRTYSMPSPGFYDFFAGGLLGGLHTRIAQELAMASSTGTVLDIGCGPGHLAVRLAQIAPNLNITGADVDPEMVARAIDRAVREGITGCIRFEVGDVRALPFADGQFDLVVSTLSLHHWPDPAAGLAEVHRVLRPGGKAYIYDLSDRLLRAIHHGAGGERLIGSSPFGNGEVETFRWPGPLPLLKRLVLERKPD